MNSSFGSKRPAATWEWAARCLQLLPADVTLHDVTAQRNTPSETWRICPRDTFRARSLLLDFVVSDHDYQTLHYATNELSGFAPRDASNAELLGIAAEMVVQRRMTMVEGTRAHGGVPAVEDGNPALAEGAKRIFTPSQLRIRSAPAHEPPAAAPASRRQQAGMPNVAVPAPEPSHVDRETETPC